MRYHKGQRWAIKPPVTGFEDALVIGGVIEAHPEWGWNERTYEVYVRYGSAAKGAIPADYDGVILSLNDAGMDRSVAELVESGVELPWWWVYGRRFEPERTIHFPNDPLAVYGLVFRILDVPIPQRGLYYVQFRYNDQVISQQPLLIR